MSFSARDNVSVTLSGYLQVDSRWLSERRVVSAGAAVGWVPGSLTRLSLAHDVTVPAERA